MISVDKDNSQEKARFPIENQPILPQFVFDRNNWLYKYGPQNYKRIRVEEKPPLIESRLENSASNFLGSGYSSDTRREMLGTSYGEDAAVSCLFCYN